jgi:hypothetical protein
MYALDREGSLTALDLAHITNMNIFQAEQALLELFVAGRARRRHDPASKEDRFERVTHRGKKHNEVCL